MVVIRLSRGGAKKRPFYHVVVTDKRSSRDGKFIEQIGYFNPIAAGNDVCIKIDTTRAEYWIKNGAQPSDRVKHLLKVQKETQQSTSAE